MRKNAIIIQRFVRSKITKEERLNDLMSVFLTRNQQFLVGLRIVEQSLLFHTEGTAEEQRTLNCII